MHPQIFKEKLEDKKQSFREDPSDFLKQYWGISAALTIFVLALYLRYLPEQGMKYLQALDPYWIFRQSQHLALEGNIPAVDFMRYFPYNAPFPTFNNGNIVIPALLYWLGPSLLFNSYLEWAQFYPALMGALGVLLTYFLGKEIYDKYAGVSAAFFLATIPGVLHRTSAGFFEKEPTGSFFMLLSMYFFTRAWKRDEYYSSIISGISLGLFTISWGGSSYLWLLYPLTVGVMMLLNEDIEKLVGAYTPVVLIGGGFAAVFNPYRFWFTSTLFIGNLAGLAFLWSRYLVEELELIKKEYIPYYTPSMTIFGLLMLVLSPLYSDWVASKFMGLLSMITQKSGGVIAGTVAENTAASLGQLVGQLGARSAIRIGRFLSGDLAVLRVFSTILGALSNLIGAWQLAFIGVIFSGSYVGAMILRKIGYVDREIENSSYHLIMLTVAFLWSLIFAIFFQSSIIFAIGPSILTLIGGIGIIKGLNYVEQFEIEYRWYQVLPLLWAISSILGAVSKSRLIFLAAFPTSFMAGYAFSRAWKALKRIDADKVTQIGIGGLIVSADIILILALTSFVPLGFIINTAAVIALNGVLYYAAIEQEVDKKIGDVDLKNGVITAVIVLTLLTNFSAGFVNSNSLGGSPNNLWMQNLDYMREKTPPGSVILSWWDYGYWFESIGRRAAIADGGNAGYYSDNSKINYPLADFLTSSNPSNWTSWLKKHSVDYVVLDQTMIGKYSAVSQIAHNSNNQYRNMLQLSTSRNIQRSISKDSENNTLVQFTRGRLGIYLPININGSSISISEDTAPTIEAGRRGKIDCVLTPEGRITYNVEPIKLPGRIFGTDSSPKEACVAINPYNNLRRAFATSNMGRSTQAKAVLVPKGISNSTLVRLYLMDGYGMENFEKIEKGSPFGYVKMWKFDPSEE